MNSEINEAQNEISELSKLKEQKEQTHKVNQNSDNTKSTQDNNNESENASNKFNEESYLSTPNYYGTCKILKYDENNDPFLVLGPDYIYLILILFLNILLIIFFAIVHYCYSSLMVRIFGLLLSLLQISIYVYCSLKNPGFPKKAFQDPSLLKEPGGYYRKCRVCGIIVDLRNYPGHCYKCKCCIEGFDHHCAWTTKCIGSGNIKEFRLFMTSFFILLSYFGISAVWFEPSKNKCRIKFF